MKYKRGIQFLKVFNGEIDIPEITSFETFKCMCVLNRAFEKILFVCINNYEWYSAIIFDI